MGQEPLLFRFRTTTGRCVRTHVLRVIPITHINQILLNGKKGRDRSVSSFVDRPVLPCTYFRWVFSFIYCPGRHFFQAVSVKVKRHDRKYGPVTRNICLGLWFLKRDWFGKLSDFWEESYIGGWQWIRSSCVVISYSPHLSTCGECRANFLLGHTPM